MMRRGVWISLSVLTILTASLLVHAQGQQRNWIYPWVNAQREQQNRIYPTGQFVLLWRNDRMHQRFIEVNRERRRVHINYNNEQIDFVLIMRASDGNYYGFYGGTGDTETYPPTEGWVVAYSDIPNQDYSRLHTIVVKDYEDLPLNRRTRVEVSWYRFERSRVDRETQKTATVSPPTNYERDEMTFIRYYLVDITNSGLSGGRGRRSVSLSSGGILAPIFHITWTDSNGIQRSKWIGEPLPGKNDCTRRDRRGNCVEQQPNPLPNENYNQYYEETRTWNYSIYFSTNIHNPQYPVCYPVYVFKNLGALHNSGHSDRGLSAGPVPGYNVAYGTNRWLRVHRATIWENVPYEWGGKFYGARASGVRHGYNRNGTGTSLGFGLDCSGLVAVAKGDYGNTNYGTYAVVNETTLLRDWRQLRPGDVVIKPGVHVMIVCRTYQDNVYVIEAVGTEDPYPAPDEEKVRYYTYTFSYLDKQRYEPRAFRD